MPVREERWYWRFWTRVVPEGECLRWTGIPNKEGYGTLRMFGRTVYAHRFAYWLFKRAIPEGKLVRHTCDHRWCVNPEHLKIGTDGDNLRDAWSRFRRRSHSLKPCTLVA